MINEPRTGDYENSLVKQPAIPERNCRSSLNQKSIIGQTFTHSSTKALTHRLIYY